MAQQVAERYRFLYQGFVARDEEARLLAALPYERIELEEESGWLLRGHCITLWRDGRAKLVDDVVRSGSVGAFDFGRLCELLESIGFESLARQYDWGGYDGGTATVRVWPAGSEDPVEVQDYGEVGPVALWGLRAAVEGVARSIDWQ